MTIGARDLAGPDELVEREPGPGPLAVAEPADPRRQPLERDARLGHLDPALQAGVLGEQLEDRAVGPADVLGVAGERGPAERAAALAELRPDEGRDEARIGEGVLHALLLREGPQVVAVVEDDRAGRAGSRASRGRGRPSSAGDRRSYSSGSAGAQLERIGEGDLGRHVPAERVVRRGLVGHEVEALAGGGPRRLDLGGVADQGDAHGLRRGGGVARPGERLGRVVTSAGRRSRSRVAGGRAPRRPR